MHCLKLLIEHNANLNLVDDSGLTCLDIAFKHKNKDIIQTIFSNGGVFSNILLSSYW